jgi:NAD(P)H-hydrate epimerase
VLAVDIPSGVAGITGLVHGRALAAVRTVTFAALKPGLLFHPGRGLADQSRAEQGVGGHRAGLRLGLYRGDGDRARLPLHSPDPPTRVSDGHAATADLCETLPAAGRPWF